MMAPMRKKMYHFSANMEPPVWATTMPPSGALTRTTQSRKINGQQSRGPARIYNSCSCVCSNREQQLTALIVRPTVGLPGRTNTTAFRFRPQQATDNASAGEWDQQQPEDQQRTEDTTGDPFRLIGVDSISRAAGQMADKCHR